MEIWDRDDVGVLDVDLPSLLREVPEGSRGLTWTLLRLEVNVEPGTGTSLRDIEARVAQSAHGIDVEWGRLGVLLSDAAEILDTTVVGHRSKVVVTREMSFSELSSRCEFVAEIVDSNYCRIASVYSEFLDTLRKKYSDVREA